MEEKTQSLNIDFSIQFLSECDSSRLSSFSCGCNKLDHFFQNDIFLCSENKYISAYCAKDKGNDILAVFSLAHDVVNLSRGDDKDDFIQENLSQIDTGYSNIFKEQILFPAVNITYLGVSEKFQDKKIGTDILDYIVQTFTKYKIAGCQFITVDALNNSQTNHFYSKYGFFNLTNGDSTSQTRRMYLPLFLFD